MIKGAAKRISQLLKMHSHGSDEKKGGVSSVFKSAGGDSTIISAEGSGSPDSPIKHAIKELKIKDLNVAEEKGI